MKDLLVGVDAGTSFIKAVAFDLSGKQIDSSTFANEYELLPGAGAEQDLLLTWNKTATAISALAEKVPDLSTRTVAVAVTGQGDGSWLIDGSGDPVGKGLLWLDARAASIVNELRSRPEDYERFTITGTGLAACQQGPQLLWLKQMHPSMFSKARHALHCKDWLYYKLTDQIATDPSEAVFSFGDFRTRQYNSQVLDILGLQDNTYLLPPIVDGSSDQFALSPSAAQATGLLAGTPVILGYVDVICTALGAGLYSRDGSYGCTILGSTGMHMRLARTVDDVALNADATGYTMCMPLPGMCAQLQSNMSATLNIDWLMDLAAGLLDDFGLAVERHELISKIDSWAARAAVGAVLYQPFISDAGERGPFIDAQAAAGFTGLKTRHGYADLVRAVLEGLCFAARDCYSAMGELPGEIRLSGGASRSRELLTILSATLEAPVRTSLRKEAGAAGAAMMAAVCMGHHATMDSCVDEWVTPMLGEVTVADRDLLELYRQLYPTYVTTRNALQPVWHSLAATENPDSPV
jgi:erythritol kinase